MVRRRYHRAHRAETGNPVQNWVTYKLASAFIHFHASLYKLALMLIIALLAAVVNGEVARRRDTRSRNWRSRHAANGVLKERWAERFKNTRRILAWDKLQALARHRSSPWILEKAKKTVALGVLYLR